MRKLLSLFLIPILVLSVSTSVYAQTSTLPAAAVSSITVPITSTGNCSSANTCTGTVYYQTGTSCPSTLSGSTGWFTGPTFPEPGTSSVTITSVNPTTSYLIDVEAYSSVNVFNGPSNCEVITTPFHPAPFVIGTPSAT